MNYSEYTDKIEDKIYRENPSIDPPDHSTICKICKIDLLFISFLWLHQYQEHSGLNMGSWVLREPFKRIANESKKDSLSRRPSL